MSFNLLRSFIYSQKLELTEVINTFFETIQTTFFETFDR